MATQNDGSDYEVGTMDIREHQKTFAGFVKMGTWVVILSCLTLVFMALVNA